MLAAMMTSSCATTTLRWFDESVDYETARRRCKERGLELAKADTVDINTRMGNVVRNNHFNIEAWIGLKPTGMLHGFDGTWSKMYGWQEGEPLSRDWNNFKDQSGSENCVV